jgi:hypothetical protein
MLSEKTSVSLSIRNYLDNPLNTMSEPPMSLDAANEVLDAAFAALMQSNFRNDYEAMNAYESNLDRIRSVRAALTRYSGTRVDGMNHRCDDLERDWTKRFQNQPKSTATDAQGAFGGEWIKELQAEDEIDEMEELTEKAAEKRRSKAKGHKRTKGAGGGVDLTDGRGTQRDTKNVKVGMERGSSLCYLVHPNSTGDLPEEVAEEVDSMKPSRHREGESPRQTNDATPVLPVKSKKTLETHELCLSSAIPSVVVATGTCVVAPIENTAFGELRFETPTQLAAYGDEPVVYHVQMFRVVIAAVAAGPPQSSGAITSPSTKAVSPSTGSIPFPAPSRPAPDVADDDDDGDDVCVLSDEGSDEELSEEKRNHKVWNKMGSTEFEVLNDLSTTLVEEYQTKEHDDLATFTSTASFPTFIPAPLEFLRHVSTSTWVILMCHGGYFAGAVYVNTKPILHKSFHRYVVRKGQGGKQSSHDKGGGSMNSAGGQIRRGQEIKWKVAVRDLLVAWREHIDKAWVILYAAPGPDNRAILTDFNLLPASTSSGVREKSPVDLKDPRVRSAPLTTHRPTFNEVQRVFDTVSKVTIRIKTAMES